MSVPDDLPPTGNPKDDASKKQTVDGVVDAGSLWLALSGTPGVGVSITDSEGNILFANDTTQVLFSGRTHVDYVGKKLSDFHPSEFVRERLQMIRRVLDEKRPLAARHIYLGRRIQSTVWPIVDAEPPYNRVMVVSRAVSGAEPLPVQDANIEVFDSEYLDLGPLDVLSPRELEVLVFLGHGMSVPETARALKRSPKTIEHHKDSISRKLNARGQSELVAIVTTLGLDLDDLKLRRLPRP